MGGTLRADIPFRRASSSLSIEQTGVVLFFLGGILNATEYSRPSLVKGYARKALNGEIFTFDKKGRSTSGAQGSSMAPVRTLVMVFGEHLHEVGIHFHTQLCPLCS